jgi:ParB-like chromosome segregation protein Spo0J
MNAHPATNLFPLMNQEDLGAMAEDIRKNGLLHPVIITADGLVLDGRNRLKACELANVEPRFEAWEPNGATPTAWVIATNLHRRHLTASQRSAVAAEALPLLAAEAKERQVEAGRQYGEKHPKSLVSNDTKLSDAHHGKPGRLPLLLTSQTFEGGIPPSGS